MGSIGFAPNARIWREFLEWTDCALEHDVDVYVDGLITSRWWRRPKNKRSMWEQHLVYYMYHQDMYCLYQVCAKQISCPAHSVGAFTNQCPRLVSFQQTVRSVLHLTGKRMASILQGKRVQVMDSLKNPCESFWRRNPNLLTATLKFRSLQVSWVISTSHQSPTSSIGVPTR